MYAANLHPTFDSPRRPSVSGKVYSYTRFSTPEQAKGDSYRRQTDAAERWAAGRGLVIDDQLSMADEGMSAYRGSNTSEGALGTFLQLCQRGLVEPGSFLVVESLDRISRMEPLYAHPCRRGAQLSATGAARLTRRKPIAEGQLSWSSRMVGPCAALGHPRACDPCRRDVGARPRDERRCGLGILDRTRSQRFRGERGRQSPRHVFPAPTIRVAAPTSPIRDTWSPRTQADAASAGRFASIQWTQPKRRASAQCSSTSSSRPTLPRCTCGNRLVLRSSATCQAASAIRRWVMSLQ